MVMVALTSISGAPGVTTTALGLALSWPQQVLLVDADPVGGSPILTGYFKGEVRHPGTLVELFMASRAGRLSEAIRELPVRLSDRADLIAGPAGPAQAASVAGLWPGLAFELRNLTTMGIDVVIDLGRLGHQHFPSALLATADEVLVVVRNDLVGLAAAAQTPLEREVSLVVVGQGSPYRASTVAGVVGHPVRFSVPLAPSEAATFSHGTPQVTRWGRNRHGLQRALRAGVETLLGIASITELGEQHEPAV